MYYLFVVKFKDLPVDVRYTLNLYELGFKDYVDEGDYD